MTSWPTNYFNWVTTFRTADAPSADRQLADELSWVELCRYKRDFKWFFSASCTADSGIIPTISRALPEDVKLDDVRFTKDAVLNTIKHIKPKPACGPDGFLPLILKKLTLCLAEPLWLICSSLMSVGQVPADWRKAMFTHIYKKALERPSDPSSYRPIYFSVL